MREGVRADYNQVYELTLRVYEAVRQAKVIHVSSREGTDLFAHFDKKVKWVPSSGLIHEPGKWGNILTEGRTYIFDAWWLTVFPGFAILYAVLSFNLVGEGLRDALDPRLRGRR
jgi:hypothetical protein